jgi:hypothetical protein
MRVITLTAPVAPLWLVLFAQQHQPIHVIDVTNRLFILAAPPTAVTNHRSRYTTNTSVDAFAQQTPAHPRQ